MKWHTETEIRKMERLIGYPDSLLLIGSCFTENIGARLRKFRFPVCENPHGILFNPVSVTAALQTYIAPQAITESDLFILNDTWHSWQHHSRFSSADPATAVQKINSAINEAHRFLRNADHLFITLGSAWVYRLTEEAAGNQAGQVAANNHKAPASWFRKELLTAAATTQMLLQCIHALLAFNPDLHIIFTISPVRHLREGTVQNNRSKAVLIQAVHEIVAAVEQADYFPAYELVIDDLRDYRFYAEDLVHPNYAATEYVWEKLLLTAFQSDALELMKRIQDIALAFQHRPINPASSQHQQFLATYLQKTQSLQKEFPFLDMSAEINFFSSQHS
ncbi:MAG TPA: GSCFA domain-containing protein [Sediminibacterium sp.]|nr:GSCFA domain-containing protein [Sediminibacterium sp.]